MSEPTGQKGRRVLVVEDSESQALRMALLLKNSGYEPIVARDGRQGLALLDAGGISIVISDWIMPEIDGPTFCRAVRERALKGYVYIILVTAKSETETVVEGLDAGADDFLFKPIDSAVLLARLRVADRILDLERSLLQRNREVEQLAVTDALTGIYNRRYLVERLEEERRRAARYGHSVSVLMGDIDHFKEVNDEFGHHAGDAVLRAVAALLVQGTRKGVDWAARFGGEEFAVVMPETEPLGALVAAERLRRAVAALRVEIDGRVLRRSISFGVATLDPEGAAQETAIDSILKLADARLYEAKRGGRNRTVAD
jgi:diguanylate cyclase (GGDEF)-like protein